jgi:alkanesulfonate monooxygenase SsuD/methylene tetrahydromethanopterin reductase-like flavin-dependent oxidoreductase (luciferase family)
VTIDEELTVLESQLRRLKIEYEVYFSNPSKKPPTDIEWKVLNLLRKFSDSSNLSFSQRYRYNEMAQRYAIYNELWRKKARIREEGYRNQHEHVLSVQGVRPEEKRQTHRPVYGVASAAAAAVAVAESAAQPMSVQFEGSDLQLEKVEALYKALTEAKQNSGEAATGNLKSFTAFVQKKTSQIRKQYGCQTVEYTVEMQDGQPRLKAKPKV